MKIETRNAPSELIPIGGAKQFSTAKSIVILQRSLSSIRHASAKIALFSTLTSNQTSSVAMEDGEVVRRIFEKRKSTRFFKTKKQMLVKHRLDQGLNSPLIHTSFTYSKLNMDEICGLKFYLSYVHRSQKKLLKSLHAQRRSFLLLNLYFQT